MSGRLGRELKTYHAVSQEQHYLQHAAHHQHPRLHRSGLVWNHNKHGWKHPPLDKVRASCSKLVKPLVREEHLGQRTVTTRTPAPATKKPKAAVDGLKPNWQKDLGLLKAPKKSTTSWRRSISRASPSTSATSNSHPSAPTSEDEGTGEPGAFDQEDVQPASSVGKPAGTAKMGIILNKTTVELDVNGKTKTQPKPTYTNADLPFPADGHAKDLKHFQQTVMPDIVDWAATLEDPFAAPSHPAFKPTLDDIWNTYFPAHATSDAVDFMGAAAIGNWRSDAGKKAISIVKNKMQELELDTLRARRQWVADQVAGVKFLYHDPTSKVCKPDDIMTDGSSTDDSELAGGLYVDPRSAIIVSDDED
ncbi:hypothetical protein K438DRAFT_2070152 [Mycena galopus ATCC 62051]|nr:hypothetical protein K438DRAFT_2070152 [Mycena galopus ATCC 62051]